MCCTRGNSNNVTDCFHRLHSHIHVYYINSHTGMREATTDCFSPGLSPTFPLSLKIKSKNLKKKLPYNLLVIVPNYQQSPSLLLNVTGKGGRSRGGHFLNLFCSHYIKILYLTLESKLPLSEGKHSSWPKGNFLGCK